MLPLVNLHATASGIKIKCSATDMPVKQFWKLTRKWAMVVAQLVEQLLPIPEVHGTNPVIGKKLYWIFTVNSVEKKINEINLAEATVIDKFQSSTTMLYWIKHSDWLLLVMWLISINKSAIIPHR